MSCDTGETNSLDFDANETLWWYESEFTCADGSGAFGTWTVQSGSGDYTNLEGSGALTTDPGSNTATYTGTMTNG